MMDRGQTYISYSSYTFILKIDRVKGKREVAENFRFWNEKFLGFSNR